MDLGSIDDQCRGPSIKEKDHLVGWLTSYVEGRLRQNWAYTSPIFLVTDKEISEKQEFLLFGPLIGNEKRYSDGSWKVKWWLCIEDQTPSSGQFWPCFGHPKLVECDQMWSVSKTVGVFLLNEGPPLAARNSASKTPFPLLAYIFWATWTWGLTRYHLIYAIPIYKRIEQIAIKWYVFRLFAVIFGLGSRIYIVKSAIWISRVFFFIWLHEITL